MIRNWLDHDIKNYERWLKEEIAELPFLREQALKYKDSNPELSESLSEAIAASEKAITVLKGDLDGLYRERQRKNKDTGSVKAAAGIREITYGGAERSGICTEDTDPFTPEVEREDMGI